MEKHKVVCDTDVIIDYFNDNNSRHFATKAIIESEIGLENIVISAITKMELIAGAANKLELLLINKNIKGFKLLLVNPEISSIALNLVETYKLSHNLAMADSFIAATSIYTQFPLFTYNLKDYKFIDGIELFDAAKGK